VVGWVLFALLIRPDNLFGSISPIAPSTETHSTWQLLLLLIAILVPVIAALGWVIAEILHLQTAKGVRQEFEWRID
jgi:VIT1/CCC1 family predicted Fe2+/Mn2+ transporter